MNRYAVRQLAILTLATLGAACEMRPRARTAPGDALAGREAEADSQAAMGARILENREAELRRTQFTVDASVKRAIHDAGMDSSGTDVLARVSLHSLRGWCGAVTVTHARRAAEEMWYVAIGSEVTMAPARTVKSRLSSLEGTELAAFVDCGALVDREGNVAAAVRELSVRPLRVSPEVPKPCREGPVALGPTERRCGG